MNGHSMRPLRVVVDARFAPGTGGGTETVAMGLAEGLAELEPRDLEVDFLTYRGMNDWTKSYRGARVTFTEVSAPPASSARWRRAQFWRLRPAAGFVGAVPGRDGVLDRVAADVVHFPFQNGHPVRVPFVYQPHDLQHLHLPQFFDRRSIARREVAYPYLCRRAARVVVGTSWVKDDLVRRYRLPAEKVSVVPLAALEPLSEKSAKDAVALACLPPRYVVYPAVPWPHKNHNRLIEAMAVLRARGARVPLVLTGGGGEQRGVLRAMAVRHGVAEDVIDLGYLSQAGLQTVISRATAMVVPTLFESASFPIWEAFRAGTPVACANVTSLPRQVGESGLIFDPHSPEEIADAIEKLWTDAALQARLSASAVSRVRLFTWDQTARRFAALYRKLGRASLTEEDRHLLEGEPLI